MGNRFIQDGAFRVEFEEVTFQGDVYFLPRYAGHRPAVTAIKNGQYYEPLTHSLVAILMEQRPGDMIHAGTFYGDMLPSFSKKCAGTVYAFEPVLENYVLAKLCLERNALSNVALFNSALGETIGAAFIDFEDAQGTHRGGSSTISAAGQPTTIVTIDSLGLGHLSILQLDVEGFELNALKGARETILNNSPTILVEDNNRNCAPYLEGLDYALAGGIPGLTIWVPSNEKQNMHDLLVQSRDKLTSA